MAYPANHGLHGKRDRRIQQHNPGDSSHDGLQVLSGRAYRPTPKNQVTLRFRHGRIASHMCTIMRRM